jgi:UDP-N-acetylglucosamine--N-acetylmuramyl-(pentapeptide) pyrophosphoryl-undecaprenol N-acetylglucosamine transferase
MKNFVIACGGTGGHLTPGIGLAQALEEKGCPCWLFISKKQVDSRLSSKYKKMSFEPMPGCPFSSSIWGFAKFCKELVHSFYLSRKFYKKVGADAVVGFGGFSTLGPALAARSVGIPVYLHESNRKVGKAVRFLAKRADRVYLPDGVRIEGVSYEKTFHHGFPLRQDFRRLPMERARRKLGISMADKLLVILGGSQGAAALNEWVKQNLEKLAVDGISVFCVTGMNKESSGSVQLLDASGGKVTSRFVPFTDQMEVLLSSSNLVISRAGAGSLAEIVKCRVPVIMVPYPYAADDHQTSNAEFLESKGGGIVCAQSNITNHLLDEVRELMFNEEFRALIRRNLYSLDTGDVGMLMAQDMLVALKTPKSSLKRRHFGEVFA